MQPSLDSERHVTDHNAWRRYSPILSTLPPHHHAAHAPGVCYRQAGDHYLLVEYGEQALDLELRFRVHALMQALQQRGVTGVLELTPGIRSLQVHYDANAISQAELLKEFLALEATLPALDAVEVPSRIVHLPLS